MRYSDFADAFMPFDEHYSRLLGLKRMHYLSNKYAFTSETMKNYIRAWELMIMNEKATEVIRQRIAKRYRFDYKSAFLDCDLNRDGHLNLNEVKTIIFLRPYSYEIL